MFKALELSNRHASLWILNVEVMGCIEQDVPDLGKCAIVATIVGVMELVEGGITCERYDSEDTPWKLIS